MLEQAVYTTQNIQVLGNHVLMVQTSYSYFYTIKKEESVSLSVVSNSLPAHQVALSMEFSKQEYWNGLPFPSPGDPSDSGIKPGSPVLQADSLPFKPPGKAIVYPEIGILR